eukprot:751519-Hanusia_phi.AAC.1
MAEIRELEKQGNVQDRMLESLKEYLKLTEDPACGLSPCIDRTIGCVSEHSRAGKTGSLGSRYKSYTPEIGGKLEKE